MGTAMDAIVTVEPPLGDPGLIAELGLEPIGI
jgi:hypothetical protein